MKKIIASLLIIAAPLAYADLQSNVGVGIGTIIFEGHEGLISQVCAATTNGTYGNQTFAITSGTLGAEQPTELWASKQLNDFVAENMNSLAQNIAQGQGESLEAICSILAVEDTDAFNSKLQENFGDIYTSDEITHQDVISNMKRVVLG